MRWFKEEKTEHRLQEAGLTFRFEQVKLEQIDAELSMRNNARILGASVDDDTVLNYAEKMEEVNSAFPAIVVVKRDGKYVVLDGNHRLQAFMMIDIEDKPRTVDCYVVDGPDKAIELATRSFNAANGMGQSKEEKLLHIRHLLRQPGANKAKICSAFGVKRDVVNREEKLWEADKTLHDLGFRNHGFSRSHLLEMARVADNQNVMKRVARATSDFELSSDRLNSLVNHVRRYKTERTKIEAVADFCSGESAPKPSGKNGATAPNRDKCMRQLNGLRILLKNNPTRPHLHLDADSDFLQAKGIYEEIREYGDAIFGGQERVSNGKGKAATRKRGVGK